MSFYNWMIKGEFYEALWRTAGEDLGFVATGSVVLSQAVSIVLGCAVKSLLLVGNDLAYGKSYYAHGAPAAERFVREAVSHKVSLLATDESRVYGGLTDHPHKQVDHAAHRYVVGVVHTNTIEGFWSIFKRGVVGSFHKVSRKYLPLYVAEFQFRYNNRFNSDIFGAAIEGC